jgi:hypothetical protein
MSVVVSTLLLVAATGVIGAFLVSWANTTFGIQQINVANQTASRINQIHENFVLEDVWFGCVPRIPDPCINGNHYANVTIRNTGDLAITVSKIYVNNTQYWTGSQTIAVGGVGKIQNVHFAWQSGKVQTIQVHTLRGSDMKQDWKP